MSNYRFLMKVLTHPRAVYRFHCRKYLVALIAFRSYL